MNHIYDGENKSNLLDSLKGNLLHNIQTCRAWYLSLQILNPQNRVWHWRMTRCGTRCWRYFVWYRCSTTNTKKGRTTGRSGVQIRRTNARRHCEVRVRKRNKINHWSKTKYNVRSRPYRTSFKACWTRTTSHTSRTRSTTTLRPQWTTRVSTNLSATWNAILHNITMSSTSCSGQTQAVSSTNTTRSSKLSSKTPRSLVWSMTVCSTRPLWGRIFSSGLLSTKPIVRSLWMSCWMCIISDSGILLRRKLDSCELII